MDKESQKYAHGHKDSVYTIALALIRPIGACGLKTVFPFRGLSNNQTQRKRNQYESSLYSHLLCKHKFSKENLKKSHVASLNTDQTDTFLHNLGMEISLITFLFASVVKRIK